MIQKTKLKKKSKNNIENKTNHRKQNAPNKTCKTKQKSKNRKVKK